MGNIVSWETEKIIKYLTKTINNIPIDNKRLF
jgi:hypothetical protein